MPNGQRGSRARSPGAIRAIQCPDIGLGEAIVQVGDLVGVQPGYV